MPNQDQTGPEGMGPATGNGQRSQNSNPEATGQNDSLFGMFRRGFGSCQQRGHGKGRGNGGGKMAGNRRRGR